MQTQYNHYSDEEFIRLVDARNIRQYSPLIDELMTRLEKKNSLELDAQHNDRVECPICEAQLRVDYDDNNMLFKLELQ